jgi:hypothetical protein
MKIVASKKYQKAIWQDGEKDNHEIICWDKTIKQKEAKNDYSKLLKEFFENNGFCFLV